MKRRRPTRRDLLIVVGRLQSIIGAMGAAALDDRHPERAQAVSDLLAEGMELAVAARSYDPPLDVGPRRRSPWDGEESTPSRHRE